MGGAGLFQCECLRFGMHVLFSRLSIPTVVTVITAMLLERRIVVECDEPYVLSAIVMALPWLLRPYKWQTHFIPYLPYSILVRVPPRCIHAAKWRLFLAEKRSL